MRTAYLGTSEFAATVLRRLAGSPHRPALVVTPPDRRQGRGRKVSPPPVAVAAGELELELLQAENVNEEGALERIRGAEPEAVLVCAFGQLIREPLLSEFPILNVHPSLLPRWRGADRGDAVRARRGLRLALGAAGGARWRSPRPRA